MTWDFRPVAQFWLERRIDIAKVDGSSPFGSTNFKLLLDVYWSLLWIKIDLANEKIWYIFP